MDNVVNEEVEEDEEVIVEDLMSDYCFLLIFEGLMSDYDSEYGLGVRCGWFIVCGRGRGRVGMSVRGRGGIVNMVLFFVFGGIIK